MDDWVAFYDSPHSIYVNARHRDLHYARLADEMAAYVPGRGAAVLDYGCGEALHADRLAVAAGTLTLAEAAPTVRARLAERFRANPRIAVKSTQDVLAMAPQCFDLIIMHSVSQYVSRDEFDRVVRSFHHLLRPGGLLLVGDVIPPHLPAASDAVALLRFGWNDGFFLAAVSGLIRTAFSDYRRLRSRIGLTRYNGEDMTGKLAAAGYAVSRPAANLGHLQTRMTFAARKPLG